MSILNRRAKFDYDLKDIYVAGIVLQSNEVKPLRAGRASIQSSYISEIKGEIYANNLEIITVKKDLILQECEIKVKESQKLKKFFDGKKIFKTIFVKNKIINYLIK